MLFSKYYKCLWCVISTIRLVVEYTFIIKLFEYTNIIYVIGIYTQVIIVIFTNKVKTSNPCKTVYTPCTRSKRYTRPRRLSTVYRLGKHWWWPGRCTRWCPVTPPSLVAVARLTWWHCHLLAVHHHPRVVTSAPFSCVNLGFFILASWTSIFISRLITHPLGSFFECWSNSLRFNLGPALQPIWL